MTRKFEAELIAYVSGTNWYELRYKNSKCLVVGTYEDKLYRALRPKQGDKIKITLEVLKSHGRKKGK